MGAEVPEEDVTAAGPEVTHGVRPQERELIGYLVADRYRVLELVARGGMGVIYRAHQEALDREVALKVTWSKLVGAEHQAEFLKRFVREAALSGKLRHPNIVTVHDYGELPEFGACFIAMEFLEGQTLAELLNETGPLPPRATIDVAIEICKALEAADAVGVVHRDLKPSNVMLVKTDAGQRVVVLDFGLAKAMIDDGDDATKEGSFLGTPRYMSPEFARHERLDIRSDIYSLGIILYQMLSGKVPFASERTMQTLMMHLNDPVPSIEGHSGIAVPPEIESLVVRCLAKSPVHRPESPTALRQELAAIRDGAPKLVASAYPPRKRTPLTAIAVAVAALLGLVGGGTYVMVADPENPEASLGELERQVNPPEKALNTKNGDRAAGESETTSAVQPAVPTVLAITSQPAGANVLIDGENRGVTPWEGPFEETSEAGTPIEVQLDGYLPTRWSQKPIDESLTVRLVLQREARKRPWARPRTTMSTASMRGPDPGFIER